MAGTVSSDVTDGPVLNVINKRIRALRKKYNRIIQMEESGKALNKEQEETLRSKPFVLSAIDELERIKQPISVAVSEEVSSALQQKQHNIPPTDSSSEPNENSEANSGEEVEKLKEDLAGNYANLSAVQDLLNLLYFGSLFDVKTQNDFMATMLTRTHERGCCLTYDYVTDDDAAELLGERDLDLISMLGGLLTSRAVDSSLPHKNALLRCAEHAKSWLDNSDQRIVPDSEITYAGLRQKLNKIMDSEYFTKTPEMKAPNEFQPGAFQVPSQGAVIPVNTPDQVEAPHVQVQHEQQKEEAEAVKTQGIGNFEEMSSALDDIYQGEEGEKYSEIHVDSEPPMGEKSEIERGLDYIAGASNQYHRGGRGGGGNRGGGGGGGRRAYSNGGRRGSRGGSRGGGAYFNGRNQYYEQGDGYYPRNNNYFRGRGGRGVGGGSNNNYQVGEGGYLVAN